LHKENYFALRIAWVIIAEINRAQCPGRAGADRKGLLTALSPLKWFNYLSRGSLFLFISILCFCALVANSLNY
jgi:hypothetical protein